MNEKLKRINCEVVTNLEVIYQMTPEQSYAIEHIAMNFKASKVRLWGRFYPDQPEDYITGALFDHKDMLIYEFGVDSTGRISS